MLFLIFLITAVSSKSLQDSFSGYNCTYDCNPINICPRLTYCESLIHYSYRIYKKHSKNITLKDVNCCAFEKVDQQMTPYECKINCNFITYEEKDDDIMMNIYILITFTLLMIPLVYFL